jgi:hypothetical protein
LSIHGGSLDGLTVEVGEDQKRATERDRDASAERLAGMAARRSAVRHKCGGRWRDCLDRNHRRDQYHATILVSMLGPGSAGLPSQEDYASKLTWHSIAPYEGELMRGKS